MGTVKSTAVRKYDDTYIDDETDIEYISPTTQRAEVGIVSTPPHSYARTSILTSKVLVLNNTSNHLQKKGHRKVFLLISISDIT